MAKKEKVPSYIIDHIQRAINDAKMTEAQFSNDPEENERIKNTIRPYMQTWIIAPLERVQSWNKGEAIPEIVDHMKRFRF